MNWGNVFWQDDFEYRSCKLSYTYLRNLQVGNHRLQGCRMGAFAPMSLLYQLQSYCSYQTVGIDLCHFRMLISRDFSFFSHAHNTREGETKIPLFSLSPSHWKAEEAVLTGPTRLCGVLAVGRRWFPLCQGLL